MSDQRKALDDEPGSGGRGPGGLSRRELLRGAGVAAGAAAIPLAWGQEPRSAVLASFAARSGQPAVLGQAGYALLEALCARLIPSDEHGPGAREACAARFIDLALGGALAGERARYEAGLAAIDAHAQDVFGAPFTALAESEQDALVAALQDGEVPGFGDAGSGAFFALLRTHTLQGTFSDPFYGGNADFVGWDLIGYPGVRMGVGGELTRMGVRHEPNHLSAYDLGMFEDGEI